MPSSGFKSWVFAAAVAVGGAACAVRDGALDAGPSTQSTARLTLSYTRSPGADASTRFDAQGSFVRWQNLPPASVATILGLADLSSPAGSCRVIDGSADFDEALAADSLPRTAQVTLLDAGRLELRGPSGRASLYAHPYPEVLPFVSGLVYGSDGPDAASELSLGQPYAVVGDGGQDIEPFSATVLAPRAFPELVIEPLKKGSDLEIRWGDADPDAEPILLEVKWNAKAASRTIRCRVHDEGAFVVPHEWYEPLPSSVTSATVTATRLGRAPLSLAGGTGDLTLELRAVAPLPVAP